MHDDLIKRIYSIEDEHNKAHMLEVLTDSELRVRKIIMLTIFSIYTVFVFSTYALFVIQSRRESGRDLVHRSVLLITIQTIGGYFMSIVGMLMTALTDFPCVAKLWLVNYGLLFLILGVVFRAYRLLVVSSIHILQTQLTSSLVKISQAAGATDSGEKVALSSASSRTRGRAESGSGGYDTDTGFSAFVGDDLMAEHKQGGLPVITSLTEIPLMNQQQQSAHARVKIHKKLQKYIRLSRFASDKANIICVAVSSVIVFVFTLVCCLMTKQYAFSPTVNVCYFMWPEYPMTIFLALILVVVIPIFLILVWKHEDAYGIKSDLILSVSVVVVDLVLTLVWELKLSYLREVMSGLMFAAASTLCIHISSVVIPLWRSQRNSAQSDMYIDNMALYSDTIDNPMNNNQGLGMSRAEMRIRKFHEVIKNNEQYNDFRKFTAASFCSELTGFIDEYQILKLAAIDALGDSPSTIPKPRLRDELALPLNDSSPTSLFTSNSASDQRNLPASTASYFFNKLSSSANGGPTKRHMIIHTSVLVTITETAKINYPNSDIDHSILFPDTMMDRLEGFIARYIEPESDNAVNLPGGIVESIFSSWERGTMTLDVFDRAKEEVLHILYTDVYLRYRTKVDRNH